MNALADFHFLRPAWLLLLGALPALWWLWRNGSDEAGAWRGAVDAHLLPHLLARAEPAGRAGAWLAAATWALLVAALAGPAWDREPVPLYRNEAARVLALELAPSMLAQDVRPSRLERARYKLNDILTRSADRQTALVAYAGDAFVAAPLTDDVNTVRNLVDSLGPETMPVAGNATARAIRLAVDLVRQAGLARGELVLLADSAGEDAVAAARDARARGLAISVLGIGEPGGAPVPLPGGGFLKDAGGNIVVPRLDEDALRALAAAGGGRYARLSADASDLDRLLVDGANAATGGARADANQGTRWRDRGPWLVLLALPLALAGFRRGWLMACALALLVPVPEARAVSFDDLWLRRDQQAARALAADDARKAADVARSPEWRGTAAYRAGEYADAAAAYAEAGATADAAYNRGNALAKLGRYEEALAAYDEALRLAPGMDDAAANRRAVEEWLKQQPPEPGAGNRASGSGSPAGSPPPGEAGPGDSAAGRSHAAAAGGSGQAPGAETGSDAPPDGSARAARDAADPGTAQDAADPGAAQGADAAAPPSQDAERGGEDATDGPRPGAPSPEADSAPADAAGAGPAGTPSEAQQQALRRALDEQLANGEDRPGADSPDAAPGTGPARPVDPARSEREQALEQWLERVPDDPGGLLRRKFLLEYQQRQRDGGGGR